jgi:pyruvate dehydrogenase E1 component alpha subunit
VCENNIYSEYTRTESVTAGAILARPQAMGMQNVKVDGNDVDAVRQAASAMCDAIRDGVGPCFIETLTYRHFGHSRSDPAKYRPAGEMELWKQRDPILTAARRLRDEQGWDDADLQLVQSEVDATLSVASDFATSSPFPTTDDLGSEFKRESPPVTVTRV